MNSTTPEERAALRAAVTCKPDSVEEAWACVRVLKDLAPRLADDVDRLERERDEAKAEVERLQIALGKLEYESGPYYDAADLLAQAQGGPKAQTALEKARATVTRLEAALRDVRDWLDAHGRHIWSTVGSEYVCEAEGIIARLDATLKGATDVRA